MPKFTSSCSSAIRILSLAVSIVTITDFAAADDSLLRLSDGLVGLMPEHTRMEIQSDAGGVFYLIVPNRSNLYENGVPLLRNIILNTVDDSARFTAATSPSTCWTNGNPSDASCCALTPTLSCIERLRGQLPAEFVDTDIERSLLDIQRRVANGLLIAHEIARSTKLVPIGDLKRLPKDKIYYQWIIDDRPNIPVLIASWYLGRPANFANVRVLLTEVDNNLMLRLAATVHELIPYLRLDSGRPFEPIQYACLDGNVSRILGQLPAAELVVGDSNDAGLLFPSGGTPFGPFSINSALTTSGWLIWAHKGSGPVPWTPPSAGGPTAIASYFRELERRGAPRDKNCFPVGDSWLETAGPLNGKASAQFVWSALLLHRMWYGEGLGSLSFPIPSH